MNSVAVHKHYIIHTASLTRISAHYASLEDLCTEDGRTLQHTEKGNTFDVVCYFILKQAQGSRAELHFQRSRIENELNEIKMSAHHHAAVRHAPGGGFTLTDGSLLESSRTVVRHRALRRPPAAPYLIPGLSSSRPPHVEPGGAGEGPAGHGAAYP